MLTIYYFFIIILQTLKNQLNFV